MLVRPLQVARPLDYLNSYFRDQNYIIDNAYDFKVSGLAVSSGLTGAFRWSGPTKAARPLVYLNSYFRNQNYIIDNAYDFKLSGLAN